MFAKGGLISERFSHWFKSPKMGTKSRPRSLTVDSAQGCDLAPILGDVSQSENFSEIRLTLALIRVKSFKK